MTAPDSQQLESYVPVYDVIPDKWEEARGMLAEYLKKITNSLNVKEIGFYLDEELLSGKSFIPGPTQLASGSTSQQFRSVLRKVIDMSPLSAGANSAAHGISITANFTLIDLWVSATNSGTLTGRVITGNDVGYDVTNITINSPGAFDRAYAFIEYIQEL